MVPSFTKSVKGSETCYFMETSVENCAPGTLPCFDASVPCDFSYPKWVLPPPRKRTNAVSKAVPTQIIE